jgi:hypothetical protein
VDHNSAIKNTGDPKRHARRAEVKKVYGIVGTLFWSLSAGTSAKAPPHRVRARHPPNGSSIPVMEPIPEP